MAMTGLDSTLDTAANYRAFARLEASGRSPAYEKLADAVAVDGDVLTFLAALPPLKRQPNLFFAAARLLLGEIPEIDAVRGLVQGHSEELAAVMMARRTQTNEVGRCATLLPALAMLPEPLALIEVGASAGLALLMDRYSYDYDGDVPAGQVGASPVLRCHPSDGVPIPGRVPRVVWRAGLDLNPLDVMDDDDVSWLQCLVWPGQPEREERLMAAIRTARTEPPEIVRGDLLVDLPALVERAPADATVVVFHSAVLAYVDAATRQRFADLVRDLGVRWLSNEGTRVLPDVEVPPREDAPFLLVQDGTTPLAFTAPHGEWMQWLAADGRSEA
jgi:hypothetical protein